MNTIDQWLKTKQKLNQYKKQELELRNQLCSEILADKLEGSVTTEVDDYKLSATAKLNYHLDIDKLNILLNDLNDMELRCIKYKPFLNLSAYRLLPEDSILHTAITIKPGQATLKVV